MFCLLGEARLSWDYVRLPPYNGFSWGYAYVLPLHTVSISLLLLLFKALSTRIWGWISNYNYFIHPVIWGKIVGYFTHHEGSLVLNVILPDSTGFLGFPEDTVHQRLSTRPDLGQDRPDLSPPFLEASQGCERWSDVKVGLVKP